jgi:thiol-disulfide isomerase/thioredoxin
LIAVLAGLLSLGACDSSAPVNPASNVASKTGILPAPLADGRWKIINYWAIWCGPCRDEIPELNSFAEAHSKQVAVYAVNFDRMQGEELTVQASELGIEFALLATDPASALGYPAPAVLPTTVVINPGGEVVATLAGPQTRASLEATLK